MDPVFNENELNELLGKGNSSSVPPVEHSNFSSQNAEKQFILPTQEQIEKQVQENPKQEAQTNVEPVFSEDELKGLLGKDQVNQNAPVQHIDFTPEPQVQKSIAQQVGQEEQNKPAEELSKEIYPLPENIQQNTQSQPQPQLQPQPQPQPSMPQPQPLKPQPPERSPYLKTNAREIYGNLDIPKTPITDKYYKEEQTSIYSLVRRFVGTFILIFVISYTAFNAPALILKAKYFWETDYRNEPWETKYVVPAVSNQSLLVIPKINAEAPIFWDVAEENIQKQLEKGVAHYAGTAKPGQTGNVFISGHSSYYSWAPGDYKTIFALLNELNAGDPIYIQTNGTQFTYTVTDKKVVNPDDLSVLEQPNEKILSLMTCVPIGTALQRLVVIAKQT